MKILIGYPPLKSEKGIPTLSQNRQFQWFSNPTLIFPIVMGSAATLLKSKGYDICWKDCIAENVSDEEFFSYLEQNNFDAFMFETKTPVIKEHWKYINKIKEKFPKLKIILVGDHVSALPEESFRESKVDYVLTGGDYDFLLLNLVEHVSKSIELEKGIYYRVGKKVENTGKFELNRNLNELPFIDRDLCNWKLYQKEYNFPERPYMYIMSGRDCWYGKCKFCAWPTLYPKFRTRKVENVLDEIGILIDKYKIKGIFDDSGTFPIGSWLVDFCNGMISRGYNKRIKINCNMRFGALKLEDYKLMKEAGFRLLKFGLESGNQKTLDFIDKNIKINDIIEGCELAKKARLIVHLTMITGWPESIETYEEAMNTYKLAKKLMVSGKADVLQATIVVPYPGTKLYEEALKNKWFRIDPKDYDKYDMKGSVLKENSSVICKEIYKIFINPKYVIRHLFKIRSFSDVKYTLRGFYAVIGHMKDFLK